MSLVLVLAATVRDGEAYAGDGVPTDDHVIVTPRNRARVRGTTAGHFVTTAAFLDLDRAVRSRVYNAVRPCFVTTCRHCYIELLAGPDGDTEVAERALEVLGR